jgi:hypothetical protein
MNTGRENLLARTHPFLPGFHKSDRFLIVLKRFLFLPLLRKSAR